jgi:hypothetical protein
VESNDVDGGAGATLTSRRTVLKGLGGLGASAFLSPAAAEALFVLRATGAAAKPVFLTSDEFALVDALSERIIPTDAHSPGARAARVADFVDLLLSEQDAEAQAQWRAGLAALDESARAGHSRPFAELDGAAQDALLAELAKSEGDPTTPLERFFVEAKLRTIQGYYTSEIGIHKDLRYKGNQFLAEFVGYEEQA